MKKFFVSLILLTIFFSASPVQANFESIPLSYIYSGTVVNVRSYLVVREQPDTNSREVMRIRNGARLSLRYTGNHEWWQVLSVDGNSYNVRPGDAIGWISAHYVQIDKN